MLIATAACAVIAFLSLTGPTSSRAFRLITGGMSRDDVLQTLGQPDERQRKSSSIPEQWRYRRDWIDFIATDRYVVIFNDLGTVTATREESRAP
jgi:hypothetical protein